MTFDDPVVIVLIVGAVLFLFGSKKIPEFARNLGKAKNEFDKARQGITEQLKEGPKVEEVTSE